MNEAEKEIKKLKEILKVNEISQIDHEKSEKMEKGGEEEKQFEMDLDDKKLRDRDIEYLIEEKWSGSLTELYLGL